MWRNQTGILRGTLVALAVVALAGTAQATTNYGDFAGTNVDFLQVRETSSFGDPEPLFGAPTVTGDQLLFFPADFTATTSGAGGLDQTGAQLQLEFVAQNGTTLDLFEIEEFGDNLLLGAGTGATGTFISLSGFITVTETLSGPISPTVIGFTGVYAPSQSFSLPGDFGTSLWSASATVDIASIVPDATRATLSLDNDLTAFSEAGTSAKTQKKVVDGPAIVIEIVPEPTTAAMFGLGLVGLSIFSRRNRR